MAKQVRHPGGQGNVAFRRVRSGDFSVHYANGVQIAATRWDVQLIFERFIAPPTEGKIEEAVAEQQIAVVMSREHARSLLELLQRQLL